MKGLKTFMKNYIIRLLDKIETPILEEFIYQAIFQRPGEPLLPRSIIKKPAIAVFIEGFGRPEDTCLVAEMDGKIVGAVWARILNGEVKGFGNIDKDTPEFAISLLPEHRGQGIGTDLMQKMLALLKEKGYSQASLAVQKDNYAVQLYRNTGFEIVAATEEEYIMVAKLH